MAEGDDDWTPVLFTKIILRHDVEVSSFLGKKISLQIDAAYTIGKSIAIIFDENVIAHFTRKKMNSFPGVGVMNCPDSLRPFISYSVYTRASVTCDWAGAVMRKRPTDRRTDRLTE